MSSIRTLRATTALVVVSSLTSMLAACGGGGGGGGSEPDAPPSQSGTRTVGGTVTGLSGSGLVLQNNGGDNLAIGASGAFTFATAVAVGNAYAVTALSQPTSPAQTCAVSNGSGSIGGSNISNVAVTCTTNTLTVSVTVSGLTGSGLMLSNGVDRITANTNGAFTFDTRVGSGSRYNVVIDAAPADPVQRCSVTAGSGTITNANIDVAVSCVATFPTYAYSLNRADGTLSSYAVDAESGRLHPRLNAKTGTRPITAVTYTTSSGKQFSYVVNQDSNDVSAFALDKRSGALTRVSGSPFTTSGSSPKALVLHPTRPFLYVPNEGGTSIAAFSINSDSGVLTSLGPVTTGSQPQSLVIEATGRFAYVAAPGSLELYTYAIDQTTGALTEVANSRLAMGGTTGGIALQRDGRFLYLFNPTAGTISAYAISATTGVLSAVTGSPFNAGTNAALAAVHPNGKFIYVKFSTALQDTASGLAAYAIDATTGALSAVAGSPFDVTLNPRSLAFDPTGRYLYAGHVLVRTPAESEMRGYSVNASSGALSAIPNSVLQTGLFPSSLAIDGSGKYVYATNETNNQLSAFFIRNSGALAVVSGGVLNAGNTPAFISVADDTTALQLSSKALYVADTASTSIRTFNFDAAGMLTPGASLANSSSAVVLDPLGRFAYAANPSLNSVSIYAVTALTGALTEITGSPVAVSGGPRSIAIEPSGHYAYVSTPGDDSIKRFTIDATAGGLSSAVSIPADSDVKQLAVAPNGRWLLATSSVSSLVRTYDIDPVTGALGAETSIDTTGPVQSLAIDSGGRYAYVTDVTNRTLRIYSISSQNGVLASVGLFDYIGIGGAPAGVAIDPAGGLLYTADTTSNNVSVFRIQANGTLSYRASFPVGTNPIAIATDYSGKFLGVGTGNGELLTYAIDRSSSNGNLTFVDAETIGAVSEPGTVTTSSNAE